MTGQEKNDAQRQNANPSAAGSFGFRREGTRRWNARVILLLLRADWAL